MPQENIRLGWSGRTEIPYPSCKPSAYSKYVGHLVLEFDADGELLGADGDTLLLDASVEPNAEIVARVAELAGPIGRIKVPRRRFRRLHGRGRQIGLPG